MRLFDSYLEYLSTHPGRVDSIILWTLTMAVVWFIQFKYREKMLTGMSGVNALFEAPEQVAWILNWCWPPIVAYSAYFNQELSLMIWYFIYAAIAYTLGGRWIFEWVLALRAGATKVESREENKTEQK